jgi:hypothetical protein
LSNVRFQGAGRYLLILSSSQFDSEQTLGLSGLKIISN